MAKLAGFALKLVQTVLYALTFCCAAIVLGFYSYFLALLSERKLEIPTWAKAVEGISGAGVLYLVFAVILTCCLGGIRFFAFLAIVLDIIFAAGFIALAVLTRDGASACTGNVNTPIGNGPSDSKDGFGRNGFGTGNDENVTFAVSLGTACRYNTVCFAVSIIGALLFIISAFVQLWLGRHHKREKRFGPSPKNNYTSGSGRRGRFGFGRRGPKTTHQARDAEMASSTLSPTVGTDHTAANGYTRPSHDTAYTGSTAAPSTAAYDSTGKSVGAGGYHTHPTGTGVNPYGYDHSRNAATNY